MANVCAIYNDELYVCTTLKKPNGLSAVIPLESLYCRYGLILPTEYASMNLLDVLEGKSSHHFSGDVAILGCILTHLGDVYEFYLGNLVPNEVGDTSVRIRRIPTGDGVRYVKSNGARTEEQVQMLMHLYDIGRIESMRYGFSILNKCSPGNLAHMEQLSVEAVMASLIEKGCTEPFPSNIIFHDMTPPPTKE
ncbi:hypothetical protein D3C85_270700 [compost metagenome]